MSFVRCRMGIPIRGRPVQRCGPFTRSELLAVCLEEAGRTRAAGASSLDDSTQELPRRANLEVYFTRPDAAAMRRNLAKVVVLLPNPER
jgi:hypothetical protein